MPRKLLSRPPAQDRGLREEETNEPNSTSGVHSPTANLLEEEKEPTHQKEEQLEDTPKSVHE